MVSCAGAGHAPTRRTSGRYLLLDLRSGDADRRRCEHPQDVLQQTHPCPARTPLVNTNATNRASKITIARVRTRPSTLAIEAKMSEPISWSCHYGQNESRGRNVRSYRGHLRPGEECPIAAVLVKDVATIASQLTHAES